MGSFVINWDRMCKKCKKKSTFTKDIPLNYTAGFSPLYSCVLPPLASCVKISGVLSYCVTRWPQCTRTHTSAETTAQMSSWDCAGLQVEQQKGRISQRLTNTRRKGETLAPYKAHNSAGKWGLQALGLNSWKEQKKKKKIWLKHGLGCV